MKQKEKVKLPAEIEKMFSFEGKILKRIDKVYIERYKELYKYLYGLFISGELPQHNNYLGDNELAKSIYEKKYYLRNREGELIEKRPEEVFMRVSAFVAAVEENMEKAKEFARKFYIELYEGRFIPGGRVLAGAGDLYRLKTLANCFVSLIEDDSIESIYKAAYEAARTYSYGGGIGIDISVLRPKDSIVHNAANKSTGAVSFMDLYSLTTGLIGQNGRRGALMITIDIKHPDIIDFINSKRTPNWVTNQIITQLEWEVGIKDKVLLDKIRKAIMENTQIRFANISIKMSDEFLKAVEEQNTFGKDAIIVYKKKDKETIMRIDNIKDRHYSYGIPSKDISKYEFIGVFNSLHELNNYLRAEYNISITKDDLDDVYKRDVFGDLIVPLSDKDYDLAIRYAGDFLLYFSSEQTGEIRKLIKARDIWDQFIESNYKTAEPGLMFWNKMTKYSPSNYIGRKIITTNPCGEVPLEDGGACNLGSVNLSRFVRNGYKAGASIDYELLKYTVSVAVRFLDNITTWNSFMNPLEKQREAAKLTRRVGLGVVGIADMLNQLGLGYDSDEGLEIFEKVMKLIANEAYLTSTKLAMEKGKVESFDYEKYSKNPYFNEVLEDHVKKEIKKHGLRNSALLSIAPTGTISNIVLGFKYKDKHYIGVSSGIEPIFALYYTRRTETVGNNKIYKIFHSTVQAYIDMYGLNNEVQELNNEEELKKVLPEHFFRTAHKIDPFKRIEIQSIAQKYVDHSISSTVNLPEDIEVELLSDLYLYAWKMGLKGVTIYREGSRFAVLSTENKKTEFQEFKDKIFKVLLKDGREIELKGDDVLSIDGKLYTVYHAYKKGLIKIAF